MKCSPPIPAASGQPIVTPPARDQESFDKQYVRNYLEGLNWDKRPPAPPLSDEVVAGTRARYLQAYEMLTGRRFAD